MTVVVKDPDAPGIPAYGAKPRAKPERQIFTEEDVEMFLCDIVAANIRKRREAMGMSMRELSRRMGSANSSRCVGAWESGRSLPGAYSLCALADVFGCTVDEILGRNLR